MSEYQYQEALNARAEQNREAEERRAKMAGEAERMQQAVHLSTMRRLARRRLIMNVLLALAVVIGLRAALAFNLIALQLAFPIMLLALVWACVWVGAYLQMSYCKGGLLEWKR